MMSSAGAVVALTSLGHSSLVPSRKQHRRKARTGGFASLEGDTLPVGNLRSPPPVGSAVFLSPKAVHPAASDADVDAFSVDSAWSMPRDGVNVDAYHDLATETAAAEDGVAACIASLMEWKNVMAALGGLPPNVHRRVVVLLSRLFRRCVPLCALLEDALCFFNGDSFSHSLNGFPLIHPFLYHFPAASGSLTSPLIPQPTSRCAVEKLCARRSSPASLFFGVSATDCS
jgi:hypothetical protein